MMYGFLVKGIKRLDNVKIAARAHHKRRRLSSIIEWNTQFPWKLQADLQTYNYMTSTARYDVHNIAITKDWSFGHYTRFYS